ncbi:UNVERIFIED_CONTAM: UDP-glucuronic acid decarboxylase 2 [Sesamum angustifolium]|uniref:UDP-glucuronic acid decarboxylase 2 n=1 Tax=Sesamum angustifolium TaxID=2727405 RepID=A0AAW2QSC0_9LAMI
MGSELIFRGHESQPVSDAYSPKRPKPWLSDIRPIRYMLREQRLVFCSSALLLPLWSSSSALPPTLPRRSATRTSPPS